MAEYRVYLVGTDDHFYDAIPMICANDAEAIEHARQLAVGPGVELCLGGRMRQHLGAKRIAGLALDPLTKERLQRLVQELEEQLRLSEPGTADRRRARSHPTSGCI